MSSLIHCSVWTSGTGQILYEKHNRTTLNYWTTTSAKSRHAHTHKNMQHTKVLFLNILFKKKPKAHLQNFKPSVSMFLEWRTVPSPHRDRVMAQITALYVWVEFGWSRYITNAQKGQISNSRPGWENLIYLFFFYFYFFMHTPLGNDSLWSLLYLMLFFLLWTLRCCFNLI